MFRPVFGWCDEIRLHSTFGTVKRMENESSPLHQSLHLPSFDDFILVVRRRTPLSNAFQAEDVIAILQYAKALVSISVPYGFETDAALLVLTTLSGKGFVAFSFVLVQAFLNISRTRIETYIACVQYVTIDVARVVSRSSDVRLASRIGRIGHRECRDSTGQFLVLRKLLPFQRMDTKIERGRQQVIVGQTWLNQ